MSATYDALLAATRERKQRELVVIAASRAYGDTGDALDAERLLDAARKAKVARTAEKAAERAFLAESPRRVRMAIGF